MKQTHLSKARRQRGAATLIVVMVIFFIISLVAAYASRNLIFEQKISANQYRATQAFEAAEAGIEWATAMLNGGRVDATCSPSTNVANDSFRLRYLGPADATTGNYLPVTWNNAGTQVPYTPSCVRGAAGWVCSCPTNANPVLADPGGAGSFPAFRIVLQNVGQPGVVRVESTGCTRLDNACLQAAQGSSGEGAARISVVLALNSALATPPSAALTVRGALDVAAAGITLRNLDSATNGLTANTGAGAPDPLTMPNLFTVPGTPPQFSVIANDPNLNPATVTVDRMFTSVFRMQPTAFRQQPAVVVVDDCATTCSAKLSQAVLDNPGRPIWVDGDMTLESNVVIGSAMEPVVIVASGNINLTAGSIDIHGLMYSRATDWNSAGNGAVVHGAAIAEGNFIGGGAPTIEYDPAVLQRLKLGTGSLVRVPGSWRDF